MVQSSSLVKIVARGVIELTATTEDRLSERLRLAVRKRNDITALEHRPVVAASSLPMDKPGRVRWQLARGAAERG